MQIQMGAEKIEETGYLASGPIEMHSPEESDALARAQILPDRTDALASVEIEMCYPEETDALASVEIEKRSPEEILPTEM